MTSQHDRKQPHVLADLAARASNAGNLPKAWNLASELRVFNLATLSAFTTLGRVAETIGAFDLAVEHYQSALALSPRDKNVRADLARAQMRVATIGARAVLGDAPPAQVARRHVIRAWGFGFCSELDNVLGHILLADILGREPLVWWGESSIFRDPASEDAWSQFFLPIGDISALKSDLAEHALKPGVVYPPKWTAGIERPEDVAPVIAGPPRNITGGEWSRMGSPHYATRGEAITVGDYFIGPIEAHTWAPKGHWSHAKHIDAVYRVLMDKHVRLQPAVEELVSGIAARLGLGNPDNPVLGVHVRESDKVLEDSEIARRNAEILERARAAASNDPRLRILLITDSEPAVARYQAAIPGRVISLDTVRSSGEIGVHAADPATGSMFSDRRRLGLELVRDIYLAARCERFMGVGSSNVAAMIPHMRDWPKGACTLVGENMHHQINAFIHEWHA